MLLTFLSKLVSWSLLSIWEFLFLWCFRQSTDFWHLSDGYSLAVRSPRFFLYYSVPVAFWRTVCSFQPSTGLWHSSDQYSLAVYSLLVYCVLSVAFWHSTCSYWVLTLLVFLDVVTSYWRKVYLLLEKEGYGLTSVWDLFWRTVVAMTFCATKCPYCNYFPGLYFRPRGVGLLFSVAVTWWNTHFV